LTNTLIKLFRTILGELSARSHVVLSERSLEQYSEKAKERWLNSNPDRHLTWDVSVSGDPFIEKVLEHTSFDYNKNVLEIGPGYGRLLKSILGKQLPFSSYYGIDLSSRNIAYLNKEFKLPNVNFVLGNAENMTFDRQFDLVLSSLTFKHIPPHFGRALAPISRFMKTGSLIFFDLIEGSRNFIYFENDGTFIRSYNRSKVRKIVKDCNLELVSFDSVRHDANHLRLMVMARKNELAHRSGSNLMLW
jgi:SAM-dependent methyltransferase